MEKASEDAFAVHRVFARIKDVVVPHQIDEFARHQRAFRVACVQRQKLTVSALGDSKIDFLAVERFALALHFEKDWAQIDFNELFFSRDHFLGVWCVMREPASPLFLDAITPVVRTRQCRSATGIDDSK